MFPKPWKWFRSKYNILNHFSTSSMQLCNEDHQRLSGHTHRVNNFEKRLLVWMKKYKNVGDVPVYVTPESVERARSYMRIRISNIMMLLTLFGCIAMIYSGKKAHERGESVQKYNLEWHQKFQEEEARKENDKS